MKLSALTAGAGLWEYERQAQEFSLADGTRDARMALARWYDFDDWAALEALVTDADARSFELAVDAVVSGDLTALTELLRREPDLVKARSRRVTHFNPKRHGAMLLHYVAANGVEGYRQKTPPNAVAVARVLLEAGAQADGLADLYGGECTTLALLVSSAHPAKAGLQVALVDTLVDAGASIEALGTGNWRSPLWTALVFGYGEAAEALIRRGARVDRLAVAAGMGMVAKTALYLDAADAEERHRAVALAAQTGQTETLRMLIDAGVDLNRYNPEGMHSHSTPLHQAVCAGQIATVRMLVDAGARIDVKDRSYRGTPLGWAEHCGQPAIAAYLRARGAQ